MSIDQQRVKLRQPVPFGAVVPRSDERRASRPDTVPGMWWPIILTVVVLIPLLVVAWMRVRQR